MMATVRVRGATSAAPPPGVALGVAPAGWRGASFRCDAAVDLGSWHSAIGPWRGLTIQARGPAGTVFAVPVGLEFAVASELAALVPGFVWVRKPKRADLVAQHAFASRHYPGTADRPGLPPLDSYLHVPNGRP